MFYFKFILILVILQNSLGAESFRQWMKSHNLREEIYDYYDDFDSDGIFAP